eukprot:TRINITY_DN12083_c0_g1_i1.p1 TRINITY_DN12083_c0_g1~~TRINITY_DN12083_c0_g1_i1.p1  ORF type:complete len:553 (+),score=88.05 TRINITY_DN12083_c0_g1_i1:155-1813(+)
MSRLYEVNDVIGAEGSFHRFTTNSGDSEDYGSYNSLDDPYPNAKEEIDIPVGARWILGKGDHIDEENDNEIGFISGDDTTAAGARTLSAWKLLFLGYFLTCGGPFGMESAIGAAGPLITYISFVGFPFIWSVPQAVMSAELSLMMRENGGNIVWVQKAFGDFFGWLNAYDWVGQALATQAITVVLFVTYFDYDFTVWQEWLLKGSFVLLVVVINIIGIGWVSKLSLVSFILFTIPFAIIVPYVFIKGDFKPHEWLETPKAKDIEVGVFISTLVYAFGGFDSLGTFAGEVKGGKKTFTAAIFGVLPINIANYMIPLMFGYLIIPHWNEWETGYFTKVAGKIGIWLKIGMIIGSALSNFGMVTGFANVCRVLWAMARGKHQSKKLPTFIYSWSWQRREGGTVRPVTAIIVTGVVTLALSAFPYKFLVQLMMMLRIVNLLLEYGALIRLRYSHPDVSRPFTVPGGLIGAWLLPVTTVGICTVMCVFGSWRAVVTGVAYNVAAIILYFLFRLGRKFRHKIASNQKKGKGGQVITKQRSSSYGSLLTTQPKYLFSNS